MELEHGRVDLIPRAQMNEILERNFLGHLGCAHKDEVYVVPITYAFESPFLYGYSWGGKKVELMRKNPHVCLEVDEVIGVFNWKSVIVTGLYEELKGEAADRGMRLLARKLAEVEQADSEGLSDLVTDFASLLKEAIIYRIRIKEVTGRSENGFEAAYDL